jgi:hypothetical protein
MTTISSNTHALELDGDSDELHLCAETAECTAVGALIDRAMFAACRHDAFGDDGHGSPSSNEMETSMAGISTDSGRPDTVPSRLLQPALRALQLDEPSVTLHAPADDGEAAAAAAATLPAAFSDAAYELRLAGAADAEGVAALVGAIEMTNATSFVWPLDELRERMRTWQPLTVVAQERSTGALAGVAGIDSCGMMDKGLAVLSVGSRTTTCPASEVFDVPQAACMCRGLLVHPAHQGGGLGSRLHRARIVALAQIAPAVPCVVLSARGRTFEDAMQTLGPMLQQPREGDATPQHDKSVIFQFTYPSSKGVVHLAHQRESEGWKFVGVDVADGGPVWMTTAPLAELAAEYCAKAAPPVRVQGVTAAMSAGRRLTLLKPLAVRRSTPAAADE